MKTIITKPSSASYLKTLCGKYGRDINFVIKEKLTFVDRLYNFFN